jgi:hypothetical protein
MSVQFSNGGATARVNNKGGHPGPAPAGQQWVKVQDFDSFARSNKGMSPYSIWKLEGTPTPAAAPQAQAAAAPAPVVQNEPDWAAIFGGGGNSQGLGGGEARANIESSVTVPDIQDWKVAEQIATLKATAAKKQAEEQAAFENVLQATGNMNASPAITFSPSDAVTANPSSWENILNTTWNA